MNTLIAILITFTLTAASMKNEKVPQTVISNGILTAKILLPDQNSGYYQSTRFDWSGVIESLKFSGHEYFGKWFEIYDPKIHDAILGPVDAFMPFGFDEAKPGDKFLMIGVGVLKKPDEKPWAFTRLYPTIDLGSWKVNAGKDNVKFRQSLKEKDYSYEYEKVVKFIKGKPVMQITHSLKNTSTKTIATAGYNHNFFVINNQPVGPGYSAEFPFRISGVFRDGPELVQISGNKFTLKRNLVTPETIFSAALEGNQPSDKVYDIKIENSTSKAGVRITCDKPLLKMVFWANPFTFCPEPYITIKADPGKTFDWTITYEFYNLGE
jgi:hypothetical protein